MNKTMEHHVFRDLAPAYIDRLTSEETNKQIEQHLEQCEECRTYLNEMQEELFAEEESERDKDKKNVDYFKKVKKKNRKKILVVVSSVVTFFLVLIAIYYFIFVNMWLANSNDVETNIQSKDMTVTLSFKAKRDHHYLLMMDALGEDEYTDSLFVYEKWNDFSNPAEILKDGTSTIVTFIDEDTLLLHNGKKQKIKEGAKITIHYNDKTEEISYKQLYDTIRKSE